MPQLTQELRNFLFFPLISFKLLPWSVLKSCFQNCFHYSSTGVVTKHHNAEPNRDISYGFMLGATSGCSTLRDVVGWISPAWGYLTEMAGHTWHLTRQHSSSHNCIYLFLPVTVKKIRSQPRLCAVLLSLDRILHQAVVLCCLHFTFCARKLNNLLKRGFPKHTCCS